MNRYFTHYWTNKTWRRESHKSGALLNHTAGNQFEESGVTPGDSVYTISVFHGRLFLLCRLSVARICNQAQAEQILGDDDLWEASEHVIASSSTPERFDFEVPLAVTEKLRFMSSGLAKPALFDAPGYLNQQTLRGVRELEPASARLLDELLSPDTPISKAASQPPPPPTEEAIDLAPPPPERVATTVYRILRDTELARRVKAAHEYRCQICGHTIEFADGSRYAEAHHIQPLGSPHNGCDVIGNILCLCPNHHAELDYLIAPISFSALRHAGAHRVDPKYVDYHNRLLQEPGSA